MQVSSINGSTGESVCVYVCVCGGPLLGLRLGCVTTARDRRMKSGQVFRVYRAALSHTTRTGKVTSDFIPTEAHQSPSAFLTQGQRQSYPDTHMSETTLDSFICLKFSRSCTTSKNLTRLLVFCLVSALHVLSPLISYILLTSHFIFCLHVSSLFSSLLSLYLRSLFVSCPLIFSSLHFSNIILSSPL